MIAELGALPPNLDDFQPVPADQSSKAFTPIRGSALRYAVSRSGDLIRFVWGHHTDEVLAADLAAAGRTLREVVVREWALDFRHGFDCQVGGRVEPHICGCAGEDGKTLWQEPVPEGTPGAYAVTLVKDTEAEQVA